MNFTGQQFRAEGEWRLKSLTPESVVPNNNWHLETERKGKAREAGSRKEEKENQTGNKTGGDDEIGEEPVTFLLFPVFVSLLPVFPIPNFAQSVSTE